MSSASWNYDDSRIFNTNTFYNPDTHEGVPDIRTHEQCGLWKFDFYGEQLEMQAIFSYTDFTFVVVDGGSNDTVISTGGDMDYWTIASDLTLGWHHVEIRTVGPTLPSVSNTFKVTASDNDPDLRSTEGYADFQQFPASYIHTEGRGVVVNQFDYSHARRVGNGFEHHRFRARTSTLPCYYVGGDAYVELFIDGDLAGNSPITNTSTAGGYFDIQDLADLVGVSLDDSDYHNYEVVWATPGKDSTCLTAGYGVSDVFDTEISYEDRPHYGFMGDSITNGYLLDTPFDTWTHLAANDLGGVAICIGRNGSSQINDGLDSVGILDDHVPFTSVWNEYGTNDMGNDGGDSPSSDFSDADVAVLNALIAMGEQPIRRLGIIPRSAPSEEVISDWNGSGVNGIQYNIALCDDPSRVTYINPLLAGLVVPDDYTETPPTLVVHPNAAGNIKLAQLVVDVETAEPETDSPIIHTSMMFLV